MQITNNTIFNFAKRQEDLKVVYREKENNKVVITLHSIQIGFEICFTLCFGKQKGTCILSEKKSLPELWAELFKDIKQIKETDALFIREEVGPLLLEWMYLLELLNTLERIDVFDENYLKSIAKVLEVPNNKEAVTEKLLAELAKHEPFKNLGAA